MKGIEKMAENSKRILEKRDSVKNNIYPKAVVGCHPGGDPVGPKGFLEVPETVEKYEKTFIPLKVGDECDFYDCIPSGATTFRCVVAEVLPNGVTYILKEIPMEGGTKCGGRDALFVDNPKHEQSSVQDFGDRSFTRYWGITNIKRK